MSETDPQQPNMFFLDIEIGDFVVTSLGASISLFKHMEKAALAAAESEPDKTMKILPLLRFNT